MSPPVLPRGLYGIADAAFGDPLALGEALFAGGCAVVQLRCKGASTAERIELARRLVPMAEQRSALLILNDDLEAAARSGAHGLHLGQGDGPLAIARDRLGPSRLIGRSTHTLAQVEAAVAEGADYLGFGPVFATTSKPDADVVVGLAGLEAAVITSTLPIVAIGGITEERLFRVRHTGVHGWAVISDLLRHGRRTPEAIVDAVPRFL